MFEYIELTQQVEEWEDQDESILTDEIVKRFGRRFLTGWAGAKRKARKIVHRARDGELMHIFWLTEYRNGKIYCQKELGINF